MQVKWYHILVIALAVFLGWHLGQKKPKVVVDTIYDTRIDTIKVKELIYDTNTLILPQKPIDTNAVVEAFVQERTQMFTPAGQTPRQMPVLAKSTVNDPMCTERDTSSCAPGSRACCTPNNVVYEYLKGATTGIPGNIGWNLCVPL